MFSYRIVNIVAYGKAQLHIPFEKLEEMQDGKILIKKSEKKRNKLIIKIKNEKGSLIMFKSLSCIISGFPSEEKIKTFILQIENSLPIKILSYEICNIVASGKIENGKTQPFLRFLEENYEAFLIAIQKSEMIIDVPNKGLIKVFPKTGSLLFFGWKNENEIKELQEKTKTYSSSGLKIELNVS